MKILGRIIKKLWLRPQLLIVIVALLLVLVSIPIFIIIFRLDQQLSPTTLTGFIRDSKGAPVEGAVLKIQEKQAVSKADGSYVFDQLLFGTFDLVIESNGYSPFKEQVKLQRFANTMDFTLTQLEYGEISYKLSFGERPFFSSEFEAKLNDEPLSIGEGFTLNTGRLLLGKYVLTIKSPYYKDIETTVEVKSGRSLYSLELIPAADLVGEVTDWLTGKGLTPDKVEIKKANGFLPASSEDLVGNKLQFKDLEIDTQIEIKLNSSGYNEFTKATSLTQGQNSLGEIALVPQGKLVTVKDDGFNRQIYVSEFNGRKSKNLLNTTLSCGEIVQYGAQANVKCGSGTFYLLSLGDDPKLTGTVNQSGDFIEYNHSNGDVFIVDNNLQDKITLASKGSSDPQVIYTGELAVRSIRVSSSGVLVFALEDSLWKWHSGIDEPEKISDGTFDIADISADGQKVLLLNYTGGSASNIWTVNTSTQEKKKLTFLPANHHDVKFASNNEFIYVSDKSGSSSLFRQNIDATLARQIALQVTSARIVDDRAIFVVSQGKNYLLSTETGKLASVEL